LALVFAFCDFPARHTQGADGYERRLPSQGRVEMAIAHAVATHLKRFMS
jgi:hypothetical protein